MTRLYRKRPHPIRCVGCGVRALRGERAVLHFSLTRVAYLDDGRMTMRGAGSIDLCESCWRKATEASAIRRRPARLPARSAHGEGIA